MLRMLEIPTFHQLSTLRKLNTPHINLHPSPYAVKGKLSMEQIMTKLKTKQQATSASSSGEPLIVPATQTSLDDSDLSLSESDVT